MQEVLSDWHKDCDGFITFSPTTPVLSVPSFTFNAEACSIAYTACYLWTKSISTCTANELSHTQSNVNSNCLCNITHLSLASACEYGGNKTCRGIPATLSNIPEWALCSVRMRNLERSGQYKLTNSRPRLLSFCPPRPLPIHKGPQHYLPCQARV